MQSATGFGAATSANDATGDASPTRLVRIVVGFGVNDQRATLDVSQSQTARLHRHGRRSVRRDDQRGQIALVAGALGPRCLPVLSGS